MADCSKCARERAAAPETEQDDVTKVAPVPYIAHEADMARQERTIFRLCVALIICAVLIAVCVGICFKLNKNCVEKIEAINSTTSCRPVWSIRRASAACAACRTTTAAAWRLDATR